MFQVTPSNPDSKVRIRSNKGPVALKLPKSGAELDDNFMKSCSGSIKALVEAGILSIKKVDPAAPKPVFGPAKTTTTASGAATKTSRFTNSGADKKSSGLKLKPSGTKQREKLQKIK